MKARISPTSLIPQGNIGEKMAKPLRFALIFVKKFSDK